MIIVVHTSNPHVVITSLGGLHKQFKAHKCVVDYMNQFPDEEDTIFNDFLTLFLHVFKGLEYLHDKKIVHGDVKGSYMLIINKMHM